MASEKVKQEIRQKIKDMMERHNITVVHVPWWEMFWFRHLNPLLRSVKHLIQEHVRGYNDEDCWNVAWYIARKSIPPLQKMRDGLMGTPIRRHTEKQNGQIQELENIVLEKEADMLTEKEWKGVLDDMIFAFQWTLQQDTRDFDQENTEHMNKGMNRQKRGLRLFSIYYNDLWD